MNYPSISVVIPSFNQGEFIEETILSVVGQQYPNLEVLVIDGGSTDNTIEIIEKYTEKISYWHSKKDKGQADAINQGMNLCSGDIVCWLNSDDVYLPGTLLDIGKKFVGRSEENYLIYGGAVTINQSNEPISSGCQTAAPLEKFRLTYEDFIVQPSSFWTRKLWQSVGELNIDYNYVLDWEWFIRASKIAEFEYVRRFYSVYRYHPGHKSSNGGIRRRKEILDVVTKYSSDYWINLYLECEKFYDKIKGRRELLNLVKIPRRHLLLPLLLPDFKIKFKNNSDLFTVLNMYG